MRIFILICLFLFNAHALCSEYFDALEKTNKLFYELNDTTKTSDLNKSIAFTEQVKELTLNINLIDPCKNAKSTDDNYYVFLKILTLLLSWHEFLIQLQEDNPLLNKDPMPQILICDKTRDHLEEIISFLKLNNLIDNLGFYFIDINGEKTEIKLAHQNYIKAKQNSYRVNPNSKNLVIDVMELKKKNFEK